MVVPETEPASTRIPALLRGLFTASSTEMLSRSVVPVDPVGLPSTLSPDVALWTEVFETTTAFGELEMSMPWSLLS